MLETGKIDRRCEHTDHLNRAAIELDRSPDDCAIAAESALPQLVAEHDDRIRAGPVLGRGERTPRGEWKSEHVEPVRRDSCADEPLGLAVSCECAGGHGEGRH